MTGLDSQSKVHSHAESGYNAPEKGYRTIKAEKSDFSFEDAMSYMEGSFILEDELELV